MKQTINLVAAPTALSPGGYVGKAYADKVNASTPKIIVESSKAGNKWYINLTWACAKPVHDISNETDLFLDSAAILVATHDDSNYFTMGSEEAPIEAAFWRSEKDKFIHIHAEGLGSVDRGMAPSGWTVESMWKDGFWLVKATFENWTALDKYKHFALAIWQGSDNERGGLKSISPTWISAE